MTIRLASTLAVAILSTPIVAVPAFAQQQGTTSGPAVGTPVVPGTAAQKDTTSSGATSVQQGAVGVGAPGATAKPGTEGGPSPRPGTPRQ
jgi:hypothetical protein